MQVRNLQESLSIAEVSFIVLLNHGPERWRRHERTPYLFGRGRRETERRGYGDAAGCLPAIERAKLRFKRTRQGPLNQRGSVPDRIASKGLAGLPDEPAAGETSAQQRPKPPLRSGGRPGWSRWRAKGQRSGH